MGVSGNSDKYRQWLIFGRLNADISKRFHQSMPFSKRKLSTSYFYLFPPPGRKLPAGKQAVSRTR